MTAGFTDDEIRRLRAETPGCAEVAHFNNAGCSLPPAPVLETHLGYLRREALIGGYEAQEEAQHRLDAVYTATAQLVGGQGPDEVALFENATRAFDMALYAVPLEPGDVILTSTAEYHSMFVTYLHRARRGVRVEVVAPDATGQLDVGALRKRIDARVRLIAMTHMPTNGGLVQPAEAVGEVAREAGVFFLLDATQTVGQIPLDVRRLGCHALAGTSRKYLRGPRGVGFLWVARDWIERLEPPLMEGHAAEWVEPDRYVIRPDAKRFEVWESNVGARLGFGAAIEYAQALGLERIWARVQERGETLRARLAAVPGVTVRDLGVVRGGIVSFTVRGVDAARVKATLRAARINVTVSPARGTLLDMRARGLSEVVRASVHYYNTDEEIDHLTAEVARLAG
ncbi:MAG: aminotransferase [Candidatus Rokuibacteriota bacterium]|nr:MAG: aminotransferase [Candidatus Rokubacteria bacterium]PYO47996.1 MAG: aminotransferase [Candidatus Rokubacteria bacterium]